jgi:hypothetical protein
MEITPQTKNILVVIVIGISLLIYSIYTAQFSLIMIAVEFIILSVTEFVFRELGYILLGDKLYFEWIISTILFILLFVIFCSSIYKTTDDNMALFALFYFNWFYLTNLITNFLNTRINNYVQYENFKNID